MAGWRNIFYDQFETLDPDWLNVVTTGATATRPTIDAGTLVTKSYTILEHSNILYDPGSLYRLTCRIASGQSSPQGYFYLGVDGIAADRTTRVNINGADTIGLQHYFAANKKTTPLGEFTTYTGYWSGQTTTGAGGEHPDIADPGLMRTGAVYFRPMMYLGYNVTEPNTSISIVDWIRIDMVRDAASRVQLITRDGSVRTWTEIQAWPQKTYDRSYSVLNIVGRSDPVVLTDVLRAPTSTATFLTRTATDRRDLLAILSSTSPVQLVSPCPDVDDVWFMPLKVTPNRLSGSGADTRRLWEVELQEVRAP